jgi:hypothetical protein
MANRHEITPADIMAPAEYARERRELRRRLTDVKRNRRLEVGPFVTFYFENYETMWHQVHEMLHIEKGGQDQIPDELAAYNPLIPKGLELVATFMIEIDEPARRARLLAGLGGIEETAFLTLDGERIACIAETDQDRTTDEGKASSVQFVHFSFTPDQIARFRTPGAHVTLGFSHKNYGHIAVLPDLVRAALGNDFD